MTQQHQGKIFSGDLYCRKAGTADGFVLLGNVTEFKTKTEVETKELIGRGKKNYGKAISSITIPKPTKIDIKFDSFDKYALARALMGEAVDKQQTVTAINKEINAQKGVWIELGFEGIDPTGFELKIKDGNKKLTPDTDFELNTSLGMILLLESEATAELTHTSTLVVKGNTKTVNYIEIEAGTLPKLDLEFRLDGYDIVSEKEGTLHIPHAVLSSDGELNWFSDDWVQSGMTGVLVKNGKKYEFLFREYEKDNN